MRSGRTLLGLSILAFNAAFLRPNCALGQQESRQVIITGVRFSYPVVEHWISKYKSVEPSVSIIIESRTATDPAQYDVLIDAFEPDPEVKEKRDYLYVGRYVLLPVANSKSPFAQVYSKAGLTTDMIKAIYFHDLYSTKKSKTVIGVPYTVYTRLQKAGAPMAFAKYYGFSQNDIKGKAVAGADRHLISAVINDSTGVSYSPVSLIYDPQNGQPLEGLVVLPVDLNGNGKVSDDEKFYDHLARVVEMFEQDKTIRNVPIEHLHVSVTKTGANPEAVKFMQWLALHAQDDLRQFGYLKPDAKVVEATKEKF